MKVRLIVLLVICGGAVVVTRTSVVDPLSGIWIGDWGITPSHRNSVAVIFSWDGTTLSGMVNPGPHALQLTKASFDARTRALHLETETISAGREVRYIIEGVLEDRTLIGTWDNGSNKGNFRLIKK